MAASPGSSKPSACHVLIDGALSRALLVTLRKADARGEVVFLDLASELKSSNLDKECLARVIFELIEKSDNPVAFLYGAHARCENEHASARHEEVKLAIKEAHDQVLNYGSTLLVLDGFVPSSPGKCIDLLAEALTIPGLSQPRPSYVKGVLDVTDADMLGEIVKPLAEAIFTKLRGSGLVADENALRCIRALEMMVSSKPAASEFTRLSKPHFDVTSAVAAPSSPPAPPPVPVGATLQQRQLAQFMAAMTALQPQQRGRFGPVVEGHTALGMVLSPHTDFQSPSFEIFANPHRMSQRAHAEKLRAVRQPIVAVQAAQAAFVATLVKTGRDTGPAAKDATLRWLCDALECNAAAEASRPNRARCSSEGFRLNLLSALLSLCRPFVGVKAIEEKIDPGTDYVFAEAQRGAFPADLALLVPTDTAAPAGAGAGGANFVSQCFFLTWRALHLTLVPQLDNFKSLNQRYGYHSHRMRAAGGDPEGDFQLTHLLQEIMFNEAVLFEPKLLGSALAFVGTAARWLIAGQKRAVGEGQAMPAVPDHFLSDLCELSIAVAVGRDQDEALAAATVTTATGLDSALGSLFECAVRFLVTPTLVHSPHVRARLGDLLFEVYLDPEAKSDREERGPANSALGAVRGLLRQHPLAQSDLAPALLALYGSVEHIGLQEALESRRRISRVLKYLWASPEHRATFRRIAANTDTFIKFANGALSCCCQMR